MSQKLTILFDLDGTLVNTAPDLMHAHNYVMKKYGYTERELSDIKKLFQEILMLPLLSLLYFSIFLDCFFLLPLFSFYLLMSLRFLFTLIKTL